MLFLPIKFRSSAMRKIVYASILCTAILFLVPNLCKAQRITDSTRTDRDAARFEIGISGGFSANRFASGQPHTGANTGYVAGLLLNYGIYKHFNIQLEANFLQQGGRLLSFKDDTRYGLPESFSTKNLKNSSVILNSLDIPLLLRYVFPLRKDWQPALYLGGSYSYNFNVTEHYQKTGYLLPGEDIVATVADTENVTSMYNRNRLNVIVGADLRLPLFSTVKLLLDFRYMTGVTPARENYSYMEKVGFGSDIRSNSFVSKIGLIIPMQ
jgi:hypothetical protein